MFLVANAAWEGTFAAARTFVVLYITVGLGQPLSTSRDHARRSSAAGTSSRRWSRGGSATASASRR